MEVCCWRCSKPHSPVAPLCQACGAIQPPSENLNFFQVFQLEPQPLVEEKLLRERFLELSKKIHPDRFSSTDGPQVMYATRWTSLVNKAYQTLRDTRLSAQYLLDLNHIQIPKTIPAELAETYFEIQEGSLEELKTFSNQLQEQIQASEKERGQILQRWLKGDDKQTLLKDIAHNTHREKFLTSMWHDLETRLGIANGHSRN